MPWTKGILLFTMVVMTWISSLMAGPWAFSETGAVSGAVSENAIRFGKLLIGAQERFHHAEAKLHRLGPSVHCEDDSMTLRIPGAIRTPHFLVDRGDQSIVPLSELPASCGFSVKRARRDVSLIAPYQGCNVRLQDGSYVLPLLVMGAPVQMSCPASRPTPMPAPTTIAPVQDPLDSQQMFYPSPFGKPWWYHPHFPGYPVPPTVPPTTPTTTTTTTLQDPNQHVFPHMYPMSMFDPYFHSSGSAATWPRYPMFPPYMYHFESPVEATTTPSTTTPSTTTPATTTPSTTTAAQLEQFAGYPPMYPGFYGHQFVKSFAPPGVKYHFMP